MRTDVIGVGINLDLHVFSEFNPLDDTPMRLLQIWIKPNEQNVKPSYEQKTYLPEEKTNRLRLVASPDGADGSVTIHQDAKIFASIIEPGKQIIKEATPDRHVWIQVVNGKLTLGKNRKFEIVYDFKKPNQLEDWIPVLGTWKTTGRGLERSLAKWHNNVSQYRTSLSYFLPMSGEMEISFTVESQYRVEQYSGCGIVLFLRDE